MPTKTKPLAITGPNFKHGLFLDPTDIDGRTRLGRTVRGIKDALREYTGRSTIVSELLIDRITYKAIRLFLYEVNVLKDPSLGESSEYIPLSNSLRLDIQQLEKMADSGKKAPDLNEYLKNVYGPNAAGKNGKE